MKKALVTFLAMTMILSTMAGCSNNTPAPSGSSSSGVSSSSSAPTPTKVERGSWNADGTEFTSTLLGVKVPKPDGWTASTDDEIYAMMKVGSDHLTDEQKKNLDLSTVANLYEFVLQSDNGSSLMLMAENLKMTTGVTSLSEKDYAAALKQQLAAVKDVAYDIGDTDTYTVAGIEFTRVPATLANGAVTQWYLLKKEGDYMAAFICTFSTDEQADFEAILSSITPA